MKSNYVTVEQMAQMASVTPNTIYRILRADQKKEPNARRIPGAFKRGSKYRGEWLIPRHIAESWVRDERGRKSPNANGDRN